MFVPPRQGTPEQPINDPSVNKETISPASTELHRMRNELYSAKLTLRAVATLLERGDIERAKAAALKALKDLGDEP
jgi:hypothetical protein